MPVIDMSRSYRRGSPRWWQRISDGEVLAVAVTAVVGTWSGRVAVVLALSCLTIAFRLHAALTAMCLVVGLLTVFHTRLAWHEVLPDRLGHFAGWACLVDDPTPKHGAVVATFRIDAEHYETWARGSPRRRLAGHLAGECARIEGETSALRGSDARRAAIRHVVGRLSLEHVDEWGSGRPLDRASNRVRRLFAAGSRPLRPPDDALFAGLVIGDDRNEPATMVDQFRDAGLSHLTAVSGQNISYVLAAAGPILRRLRPWFRWAATVGLVAWFVALTRFEPSVLRAGMMAAIAATGFVLGRERPPRRTLLLAVTVLVLVDPMLVWSVGFWLSVGATGGVAVLGTSLARFVPGPRWLAGPIAVTLSAQVGVAPISLLVFDSLPLVSIPANLLAVPVAGFVMLYGLPAALVAGALTGPVATIVQIPSAVGTRWVATVAALASRAEPSARWAAVGWVVLLAILLTRIVSERRRAVCEGEEQWRSI
jgi:competence protein ComEC